MQINLALQAVLLGLGHGWELEEHARAVLVEALVVVVVLILLRLMKVVKLVVLIISIIQMVVVVVVVVGSR